MSNEKPTGLIRHKRIIPNETEDLKNVPVKSTKKTENNFINQKSNIKISGQTKKDLNNLMNLTHTKFAYEMIESLVDSYVNNELSPDEQRAFRTLSKI